MTLIVAPVPAPVATWLLVRIWPWASRTTPEPWPWACALATVIDTTLGATALAVAVQSGAVALPWTTCGEELPLDWVVVAATGLLACAGVPYRVAANVPPLARAAARSATAVSWTTPLPGRSFGARAEAGARDGG